MTCGSEFIREDGGTGDADRLNIPALSRMNSLPPLDCIASGRSRSLPFAAEALWSRAGIQRRRITCGSEFIREDGGTGDASRLNVPALSRMNSLPPLDCAGSGRSRSLPFAAEALWFQSRNPKATNNPWERIHSRRRRYRRCRSVECTGPFANEFAPTVGLHRVWQIAFTALRG